MPKTNEDINYKKGKLQANISHKYRCKILNTILSNLTIYKKNYTK